MKFLLPILFCIATNLYAANAPRNNQAENAFHNNANILRDKLQQCDAGIQDAAINCSDTYKTAVLFASYTMPATDTAHNPLKSGKDSLKYFPKLLTDGMGVHFDPKKYAVPKRPPIDTSLTPEQVIALNNIAKQQPNASTNNTATKDSTVDRNKQH